MKNQKILLITRAALIAAIYVILTFAANALGLASGTIQVRFSEALTILPVFTPAAIPGLFVGCILANTLTGCALWDIIFGSIATLIGAAGTYLLRKRNPILATIPPIVSNMVIVPFVLRYVYSAPGSIAFFMFTVGIGELISCMFLGLILYKVLLPHQEQIFG
ncbi:MAG: QueT transporter family protein [Lachnospiraceae bacterium]|nr:QueT transporter family protein [Lachnospiraceae bacterium]